MVVKYKVHEVAKDFDVKSNAVVDLLKKFSDTAKKSQTSLTTDELDIIFDHFTQENSVKSFDAFFSMKKPEAEVTQEAAEEVKTEEVKEEKPQKAEKADEKKLERKPENKQQT